MGKISKVDATKTVNDALSGVEHAGYSKAGFFFIATLLALPFSSFASKPIIDSPASDLVIYEDQTDTSIIISQILKDTTAGDTVDFEILHPGEGVLFFNNGDDYNTLILGGWKASLGWSTSASASYSGLKGWTVDEGLTHYPNNANAALESPPFSLVSASTCTLSFFHRYETELGFDKCIISLSSDSGQTWTQIAVYHGLYNFTWSNVKLPLNSAVGYKNVKLKFSFTSDASGYYKGWNLDNISVRVRGISGSHLSLSLHRDSVVSVTPDPNWSGQETVILRATDTNWLSADDTINVNVLPVNDVPVFTSSPETLAVEGTLFSYHADASDADSVDSLRYSLIAAPSGMIIDSTTGIISWTAQASDTGFKSISVVVHDDSTARDTQSFEIHVKDRIPPAVALVSPLIDAVIASDSSVFLWNKGISSVTRYWFDISTDSNMNVVATDTSLTDTLKLIRQLINNSDYWWRVKAFNSSGWGPFSQKRKLSVNILPPVPGVPTLIAPVSNAMDVSINPILNWNRIGGAALYRLQVADDTLFTSIIMQDSAIADTFRSCGTLVNDTKYFWRVSASNAGGTGSWSSVRTFTTIVTLPLTVALISPAGGDTVKVDSVYLKWSRSTPKADRYRVEYALDSSFTNPTADSAVTDTVRLVHNLQNSTVWWRVKAHNAAGWGDWSTKSAFVVKMLSTHAGFRGLPKAFSFSISGQTGCIRYALPKAEHVSIRIYSIRGQLHSEPVNKKQDTGYYSLNMQKSTSSVGSYLVVFKAGDYHQNRMINFMK